MSELKSESGEGESSASNHDAQIWRVGGCHCSAVRFRVRSSSERPTVLDCNCLMCMKKGNLHLIVDESDLEILSGRELLSTYTFGARTAEHYFCSSCGIHPFYRPDPGRFSVNVRCLDDFAKNASDRSEDQAQHLNFQVEPFDNKTREAEVMKQLETAFPNGSLERQYMTLCEEGVFHVPTQMKRLSIESTDELDGIVLRIQQAIVGKQR